MNEKMEQIISHVLRIDSAAMKSWPEDEPFRDPGELDSMATMQLVVALEDEFGIGIDDRDLELARFNTKAGIREVLRKRGVPAEGPDPAS